MIRRVLVANRGEIALRILRACDELGIATVAVYSDADAGAPHVVAAGQAVRIGPAPPAESYLSAARILEAARSAGADAIHPGYGFLAENAAFATACEQAGVIFIGPPSSAIAAMGSKISARRLMEGAGVPVVPGETPADQSDASLEAAARRAGFPLLIKASAGGGGKGMRMVRHAEELAAAISGARHEAKGAFGDDTLYIERLVTRPRHVEIQVFADAHGGAVHLFERDCSAQRRHQKVIEESPSLAVTPRLRARMGEAAVAAAKAVGYRNAGTVEFLLEGEGDSARFYFLEMNTRLQVEHPVTEAVTGTDLVHAQLHVAAGLELPWAQKDLCQRGHAIECRVYAEDPATGYLPQAGRILLYRQPERPGVRVDAGVVEGSDVSVHYDPMVAKVIAHAETRDAAIERMRAALSEFRILGLPTNIGFLLAVIDSPAFRAGTVDTAYLDEGRGALAAKPIPAAALAAAVVHAHAAPADAPPGRAAAFPDPWASLPGWRG
ncbi:MAG: acetyl-CoA carboxylase biotin carboxylase subunit [Vicinamibacterales bacterium]